MRAFASAVLFAFATGCGFTVGVDANYELYEAEHSGEGVTRVRASELAVRNQVQVNGGSDRIRASLETTRWSSGEQEAAALELAWQENGSELELAILGAAETSSVDDLQLQLAEGVALSIPIASGGFVARAFDAELSVKSSENLVFENCRGPLRIEAPSARVEAVGAVDVDASGSVDAVLQAGGFIVAKQISAQLDAIEGDLLASTQTSGGGQISLFVPKDTPLTLVLRARQRIFVELDGYSFDSSDPERPDDGLDIVEGITVDIEGGGPQIDLAAETSVFVRQLVESN